MYASGTGAIPAGTPQNRKGCLPHGGLSDTNKQTNDLFINQTFLYSPVLHRRLYFSGVQFRLNGIIGAGRPDPDGGFPEKKKNVYFYEYSRHIPYVEDGGWAFAGLNKNPCAGRVLHGTFLLRMTKNQLRAFCK